MARDFEASLTEFLENASRLVADEPISMGGWFKTETVGSFAWILGEGRDGTVDHFNAISLDAANTISCVSQAGTAGGGVFVSSAATVSVGVWFHAFAIFASPTDRRIFLNGVRANNAGDRNPVIDRTTIGGRNNGGAHPTTFDGLIAEVGFWDDVLTDNEVLELAAGMSPIRVRPANLVGYPPIYGLDSPEPDYSGSGNPFVVTGTVQADHAPVAPPFGFDLGWQGQVAAAAAAAQPHFEVRVPAIA